MAAGAESQTFKPERMLAFSDAVMAVAITLLVLDLKLPGEVSSAELGNALRAALPNISAYALSFVVIGLLWIGHHQQFSHIRRVDGVLIWLNLFFLLTIGLIPFVTSLLSDHGDALATSIYAGVLVITSLLSSAMWWYARRDPQLMSPELTEAERREGLIKPLLSGAVFLLSIGIAIFWSPSAARWSWLLLIPAGRVADWLDK